MCAIGWAECSGRGQMGWVQWVVSGGLGLVGVVSCLGVFQYLHHHTFFNLVTNAGENYS